MSITLDIPPAIVLDAEAYAKERGTTLNEMLLQFVYDVGRTAVDREAAVRRFNARVKALAAKISRGEPYKFNRADAYDMEI